MADAAVVAIAENEVIEERDAEKASSLEELAGEVEIFGTGVEAARGVVMGDDEAGRIVADGFAEDFARVG